MLGREDGGNQRDNGNDEAEDKQAEARFEDAGEVAGQHAGQGNAAIAGELVDAGGPPALVGADNVHFGGDGH